MRAMLTFSGSTLEWKLRNMKSRPADYLYIILTIALTVYGQLMVKWRVSELGVSLDSGQGHVRMALRLLADPGILTVLLAGLLAALSWMVAMSKFQLSYAYPFTSLTFVLVLILSAWMLKEPLSTLRVAGVGLIVLGTIVASRG